MDKRNKHTRTDMDKRKFVSEDADAVLDIWGFGSQGVEDLIIDVIVCHPMAAVTIPPASLRPAIRRPPRWSERVRTRGEGAWQWQAVT